MTFTAVPTPAQAGEQVTFTVIGGNPARTLTTASIDFENDGVWDDTRSFNSSSITATFTHAYMRAGSYTARAEIIDADQTPTTRTTEVLVNAVPRRITYKVWADRGIGPDSDFPCSAFGPPVTCDGCSELLPSDQPTDFTLLGWYDSGTTLSFNQEFRQDPHSAHGMHYSCSYHLLLYEGTAGSERYLAGWIGETSSFGASVATLTVNVPVW